MPGGLAAALPALALALLGLARDRRTAPRVEHGLVVAALLLVFFHHAPGLRPGDGAAADAAGPLAAAIEDRLEEDAELLGRIASRIPPDLAAGDAAAAFDLLADTWESLSPRGRGVRPRMRATSMATPGGD